jgi:hypothetical protein
VTWAASTTNTAGYRVQFNGATARDIGFTNTFTYTLAQNAADNGTPPDPTVDVSVWGVDAFARISTTPATASAVSPLPIAPTAVTLNGFFSTLTGSWTHSPTRTFRRYRCRLTRGGVDLVTAFTTVQFFTASVTSSGEYQLWVYTEDVFGRISSEANSGTTTLVSLSIDELRANAIYSDSVGNIVTTLDALKDNNTTSGGVTYNSSATYRWTEMARSLEDRYKTLTIGRFSVTSGTTFYVRTFDGTNIKWFAGSGSGNVNITGDVATLTNYANEGLAATNAINVNTYPTRTRWELPTIEESVNIRLYHRNTGSNYVLYEFYPRRLVQSDDIQAESILAINIAAGTITADQIAAGTITAAQIAAGTITAAQIAAGTITGNEISSATTITAGSGDEIAVLNGGASGILTDGTSELADADGVPIVEETFRIYAGNAIAANAPFRVDQFGNLTATSANISGNITAGSSSVITGGTIQTSASGARVVMNAGGLETYSSSNVLQISATTANDGELRAGAGAIRLNNSGMRLVGNTNTGSNRIFFYDNSNTVLLGSISAAYSAPSETLYVGSEGTLSISSIDDTYIIANSQKVGIGTLFPDANSYLSVGGSVNISSGSFYRVNGTQVVGARITGWSAPTGTASRGAFDTGIVTLGALAQRVKALIDDLTTHGLIGPTPP